MKFLGLFDYLLRASLALSTLSLTSAALAQSVQTEEWISYRSAYKLMLQFEKYGKPKHLLQNHLQLLNNQAQPFAEGQLSLQAKTLQMSLQVDALGRVRLPLLKLAYDENAELRLATQNQGLQLRLSLALALPYEGHYEASQLKSACEQALNFYVSVGDRRGVQKRCSGIVMVYPQNLKVIPPYLKFENGQLSVLTNAENVPNLEAGVKLQFAYFVKFSGLNDKTQVVSHHAPLAVFPVME